MLQNLKGIWWMWAFGASYSSLHGVEYICWNNVTFLHNFAFWYSFIFHSRFRIAGCIFICESSWCQSKYHAMKMMETDFGNVFSKDFIFEQREFMPWFTTLNWVTRIFISVGFLQAQKLVRQKQLEIEDFSVYWDTECEMLGKLPANQIQVSSVRFSLDFSFPNGLL